MTRIAREQEKLARIPGASVVNSPVEVLSRELVALLPVEEAFESIDAARPFTNRIYAITRAAPAFKTESAVGAIFQLMIAAMNMDRITGHIPLDLYSHELQMVETDLLSCLHSVTDFLEAHFGLDRTKITANYHLDPKHSPFRLHERPLPEPEADERAA